MMIERYSAPRYLRRSHCESVVETSLPLATLGLIRGQFLARMCPDRGPRRSRNLLILNLYGQPNRRTVNDLCAECMTAALPSSGGDATVKIGSTLPKLSDCGPLTSPQTKPAFAAPKPLPGPRRRFIRSNQFCKTFSACSFVLAKTRCTFCRNAHRAIGSQ